MKINCSFCTLLLFCATGCTNAQPINASKANEIFSPVAVIELFTSQGCSSCPPADALLSKTIATAKENGQNIYALSFHVDYWNRLGWTDPFSDHAYSKRQAAYVAALHLSGAYTPQMVVNGKTEFVGSDQNALSKNLKSALSIKSTVNFKELKATYKNGHISLQYLLEGNNSMSWINVALISLKESTRVKRGENGGLTLTNENIVRKFITTNAMTSGLIDIETAAITDKNNLSIIVFIQNKENMQITGAAASSIQF